MQMDLLPATIVDPPGPVRASVLWLHGLGADGNDFVGLLPALGLDRIGVRFVFPHAPMRPVTINGGQVMRAWYDVLGRDFGADQDARGLEESRLALEAWMSHERDLGVPPQRQVLAGFSQGGAVALHTALRHPRRLAGVLALSTYLPLADELGREADPANTKLPIFLAHGDLDPVIPLALAQASRTVLEASGYPLEWHVYPMEHAVSPPELDAIRTWLARVLNL